MPRPLILLAFLSLLPAVALAQSQPPSNNPSYDGYTPYTLGVVARLPAPPGMSRNDPRWNDTGPRVTQALKDATAFCASLKDSTYRIDCLAERLDYISDRMAQSGPYAPTREALRQASLKLRAVAKKYEGEGRDGLSMRSGGSRPQQTQRAIIPIRRDRQDRANREAAAIIAETETVLLRSSRTTPEVEPQVRSIAAAVGSNKVLLRSA